MNSTIINDNSLLRDQFGPTDSLKYRINAVNLPVNGNPLVKRIMPANPKSVSANTSDWMELLRADREKAFIELVNLYKSEIHDLCTRISGNVSEAEDLTQETFIKAYNNLSSFRGDAHPRTWLYRIAINISISYTRRIKRWRMQRSNDQGELPPAEALTQASPEQNIEWKDLAKHAHRGLSKLPTRQRTAVILRTIREMPYKDIAEVMGISIGGAKANVHQGLKKLRILLEE
ncbi:MAG: RNA polymerase sigma factor [Candidatus Electryonea clarkiae]|nr:RNA polymerase sigma factor [Candidatus Electryonea clarkiae]MDP8286518.1 RNA polymerase sigma factor [Candidatus Electryonea clarkiae]